VQTVNKSGFGIEAWPHGLAAPVSCACCQYPAPAVACACGGMGLQTLSKPSHCPRVVLTVSNVSAGAGVFDAAGEGGERGEEAQEHDAAGGRAQGQSAPSRSDGFGEGDEQAEAGKEEPGSELHVAPPRGAACSDSEKDRVESETSRSEQARPHPAGSEAAGKEASQRKGARRAAPPERHDRQVISTSDRHGTATGDRQGSDRHVISTSGLGVLAGSAGGGHQEPLNRWRSLPTRPASGPGSSAAAIPASAPSSARQGAGVHPHQEPLDLSVPGVGSSKGAGGDQRPASGSAVHAAGSRQGSETGGRRGGGGGRALAEMRDRRESARKAGLSVGGGPGGASERARGGEAGLTLELSGSKAPLSVQSASSRPTSRG